MEVRRRIISKQPAATTSFPLYFFCSYACIFNTSNSIRLLILRWDTIGHPRKRARWTRTQGPPAPFCFLRWHNVIILAAFLNSPGKFTIPHPWTLAPSVERFVDRLNLKNMETKTLLWGGWYFFSEDYNLILCVWRVKFVGFVDDWHHSIQNVLMYNQFNQSHI